MQGLISSTQGCFAQSIFQTCLYGYYWTKISLGTPPQQMTVIVDSGSGDFWVRGICSPSFNPVVSTTYQYINSTFQVDYNSGAGAGGDYASDLVTVDGQTGRLVFGVAYCAPNCPTNLSTPGHGFMGLNLKAGGLPYVDSPPQILDNMVRIGWLETMSYSMYLNPSSVSDKAAEALLLFGGVSQAYFTGPLVQFRSAASNYFHAKVTCISFKGKSITSNYPWGEWTPLLDSGTIAMKLPTVLADAIAALARGVYQPHASVPYYEVQQADIPTAHIVWEIECGAVMVTMNWDSLLIPISGTRYKLPIERSTRGDGILGAAFLRLVYIVHDATNSQIAIAQAVKTPVSGMSTATIRATDSVFPFATLATNCAGSTTSTRACGTTDRSSQTSQFNTKREL